MGPGGQPLPPSPMADAPPTQLPVNPRPNSPSPKTSAQAQQEANMLSMLEAKQRSASMPTGHEAQQDLLVHNMALGKAAEALKDRKDRAWIGFDWDGPGGVPCPS